MPEKKEISVLWAFGDSRSDFTILGVHPDEWSPTYVLRLRKGKAEFAGILEHEIRPGWRSPNGTAYCPTTTGKLIRGLAGKPEVEAVTKGGDEVHEMFGIGGKDPGGDTLYLCTTGDLYVRLGGKWTTHKFPQRQPWRRPHGLSEGELYFPNSGELLRWDGKAFQPMEGPGDSIMSVQVLSDDRMVVVGERSFAVWTDDKGWKKVKCPPKSDHTAAKAILSDQLYFGTTDGVCRYDGKKIERISESYCNGLDLVGDALLAAGSDDGCFLYDGKSWERITLPQVAVGERPEIAKG